jgi:CHAT domain-containing protein
LLAPSPFERKRGETYAEEAAELGASITVEVLSDADRLAAALAAPPRPVLLHIAAHGEGAESGPYAHPYHWAPFVLTAATLAGDIA